MITQEQQREILRFAGFTKAWLESPSGVSGYDSISSAWEYPDSTIHIELPPLDANFFFKWIVPKVDDYEIIGGKKKTKVELWLRQRYYCFKSGNLDFNEAWQEAVLELIEEER